MHNRLSVFVMTSVKKKETQKIEKKKEEKKKSNKILLDRVIPMALHNVTFHLLVLPIDQERY